MRRLGDMTAPHWLALYATLAVAWIALWAMGRPEQVVGLGGWLEAICRTAPTGLGLGQAVAMWLVMAAAMMLPTAIPAFAAYDDIAAPRGLGGGGALVAGYAAIWAGGSVLAATIQVAAVRAGVARARRGRPGPPRRPRFFA